MQIPSKFDLLTLPDAASTHAIGAELAQFLKESDIIALTGTLGAGKTHLTQGICRGLGIEANVHSPTFGLLHEYHGGRLPVFHFDLYRAQYLEEVEAIGWDDYLERGGLVIAEWADRFPDLFPPETQWFQLDYSHDQLSRILKRTNSPHTHDNS